jgi:uncharacterized protein (DUF302 family)
MTPEGRTGIVVTPSRHSVDETVERRQGMLRAKGITLFALIDHSGEAERVGITMRPTRLLIFGSSRAGTPLMLAAPSIAIDLPLTILVWEDGQGKAGCLTTARRIYRNVTAFHTSFYPISPEQDSYLPTRASSGHPSGQSGSSWRSARAGALRQM